ncbi:GNAT family N-acetyltransferase [Streptomyces roseicoloratus]|uniref:GNAT family N-acetyltransferase n=1 Tax=Streptomyces roseicoloratus TaxID=2508722 RepID=A0ABY9RZ06_9ACTN|nr:GNAT family N-acetyltransferase [Streptomyces roseicoloratus]WMX46741.1 GNAT family N-acetyltransferase [Streptomyces roseicoloratus]
MEPITLTTDRLRLRPFVPEDVDAVTAACQDPGIQRWTQVPSPYTRADADFFVNRLVPDGWRQDGEYTFAVEPLDGGPLLAATGLHARGPGVREVGFWLIKEHRGHGYMTEVVTALARWAFTSLDVHRLVWRAEVGNGPSRAVAERAGFVMEGVERAGLANKGTVRDAWVASLLPSDLGFPSPLPYLPAQAGAQA